MSTHGNERRSPSGAGDRQAAPAAGGEATPREAADVRALLRAVAAQIADVDRRHGDAAKQITARADAMGQQIARVQGEVATAPRQAHGSSAG